MFLVAQLVKNPPAVQKIPVQFLGQEDLLEKEMATHSSMLAWRIPWTEELVGYSHEVAESDMAEQLHFLVAQLVKNLPAVQET